MPVIAQLVIGLLSIPQWQWIKVGGYEMRAGRCGEHNGLGIGRSVDYLTNREVLLAGFCRKCVGRGSEIWTV
jgi:hypothetical protein